MAAILSRAYLTKPSTEDSIEREIESINTLQLLPISPSHLQAIQINQVDYLDMLACREAQVIRKGCSIFHHEG